VRLNKSAQKSEIIEFKFCEENEKHNKIKKRELRLKKKEKENKQTITRNSFLSTHSSFLEFSTRYQSARITHKCNVNLSKPHLH